MRERAANSSIIVVARQAASASAFLPLFEKLRQRDFHVCAFAFTHAHRVFSSHQVDAILVQGFDRVLFDGIDEPSLLLTGTSEYADEDHRFWEWARSAGIPSLAFVDSWVAYSERFTPARERHRRCSLTPDRIAVTDRLMYDRMIESGCDERLLVITGNPAFDVLRGYVARERDAIVRSYGENYVLFVGEPFNAAVYGGTEKEVLGYTEAETLSLVANTLQAMQGETLKLVFRPHPRSADADGIRSVVGSRSNIVMDTGKFDARDLAACSRAVVGMTSLLLRESWVMGVPTLSVRPNAKLPSDVISGIPAVTAGTGDDLRAGLSGTLAGRRLPKDTPRSTLYDTMVSMISREATFE